MEKKTNHFRHHFLFAFNRGVKATEASCEICAVYREGAMAQSTVGIRASIHGEFDLKDGPLAARRFVFDEERLN